VTLEDRFALDAAGTHVLDQDVPVPVLPQRVTGRITAVAVDPSDPTANTDYVGTANGGVWK
jgi:hypothetical protein